MTRPATAQPTAIPTTAPVLSPLPDVGPVDAGREALVIWESGMIEEVEVPEVEEVWTRLELDTGRSEDSCEAKLLGGLGAEFERSVGLWAAEEVPGGEPGGVDVGPGCTAALDEAAIGSPSVVVGPADVLPAVAAEVTEFSAMSVGEGSGVGEDTEAMPSVAWNEIVPHLGSSQNSDSD